MQPVSASLMLFLSCQHKKSYWTSQKSNILKGVINPWNQNACTWTSLQVLCWLHQSHNLFNYCILSTSCNWTLRVNILTKMKKLSNKCSTSNATYNDKNPTVFVVKSVPNFYPKLQQNHEYMVIKYWKNGVSWEECKIFFFFLLCMSVVLYFFGASRLQNATHAGKMTSVTLH